jgi:hypothetical protein
LVSSTPLTIGAGTSEPVTAGPPRRANGVDVGNAAT